MSQLLVQNYLGEIDRLRKFSGTLTEGVISEAFKDLLKAWARQANLHFLSQYEFVSSQKTRIRPDGTVLHDLRVPLGYWEAKDTADDLDEEIRRKLAKGYPQDNIIFENSDTAVLIQNRGEVMRCAMTDTVALLKLVTLFFGYERQEIRDFRKAVRQFKLDIPAVLGALRARIDAAYTGVAVFREAAERFLKHARETINPAVGEADVREMLIQHILTEEIFNHVFDQGDFHRENNIARELYALEATFFTGTVKRETLKALEPYYAAIRTNAAAITSHAEKQTFLKVIYENFYKVYDKKKADRLGVIYTPNEIVKFMIEGAEWLTTKHFGRSLIDPHVEILDPATGTGTFICELLEHFRGQPQKLAHKYKNELFANEVAILPYYVANLNIEATYAAISGQFAEFPNLCFVDTLDNVGGLGIKAGYQHDMFAGLSDENVERVKRQNARKISVIIGNPPYNANQANENDNNRNRDYPRVDELIRSSYIRLSTAQKTKVYDMYARFFRWASDRLADDGVLAFVTNNSFVDARTFDGFRRSVASEFHEAYVVDLKGNARNSGERRRREGGNVFDDQIKVGIAVSFWVKKRSAKGFSVRYEAVSDYAKADEKRSFLAVTPLSQRKFGLLKPDPNANWINLAENDWAELIPVADKKTKRAKTRGRTIFHLFSNGLVTARDEWMVDLSERRLCEKAGAFVATFRREQERWKNLDAKAPEHLRAVVLSEFVDRSIKWTSELEAHLDRGTQLVFNRDRITTGDYRPYVRCAVYYDRVLVHRTYQQTSIYPIGGPAENLVLGFSGISSSKPFQALATSKVPFFDLLEKTQFLPRYRYTAGGEQVDNITGWGLREFQKAYGKDGRSFEARPAGFAPQDEDGRLSDFAPRDEVTRQGPACGGGEAEHPTPSLRDHPPPRGEGKRGSRQITKNDIFHYVYAVLHDPIYRETFALNLKREFPRIPFYRDFWRWAAWGERLLALHIGYEDVEPWPLTRTDTPDEKARAAGLLPKPILKSDRENGAIRLDTETTLSSIPIEAWDYRLGNRSGLGWILDQYKEKTPKDPTIREHFNTYRFADYKEVVINLLGRVTRVSVETVAIVEAMRRAGR